MTAQMNSPFRSCKNYFLNITNYVHFVGEIFEHGELSRDRLNSPG